MTTDVQAEADAAKGLVEQDPHRFDFEQLSSPTPRAIMWRRARAHVGLIVGGVIVSFFLVMAILAPLYTTGNPYAQDLGKQLIPPVWQEGGSWEHVFGTDNFGRDYLTRLAYGARITLFIGFFAAVMSAVIGSTLGIIGGFWGGRVDAVVVYLTTVKLALPGILIALAVVSIVGGSVLVVTLIIGFLFWDRFAVITRAVTQQVRSHDFVVAAEAIGASRARILVGEILPNVKDQIIVVISLEMAVAILVESVLSFLGLGIQPPTPSWGLMVAEGREFMFFESYLINIPGFSIFLLVMGINLVGDGIRDVTAPEGRQ